MGRSDLAAGCCLPYCVALFSGLLLATVMAHGMEAGRADVAAQLRSSHKRTAAEALPTAAALQQQQKRLHTSDQMQDAERVAVHGSVDAVGAAPTRANRVFNSQMGTSFDDRMHRRNRYYGRRPDFSALSRRFSDFAALTTTDASGQVHVDWKNPAASTALTRALLRADYGLSWDLPPGFLCPPVPQRANYIHWIEDLLAGSTETAIMPAPAVRIPATATGMDIGVGASAIYPLLALSLHPEWKMIGTDISEEALQAARANVEGNQLQAKIELRLVRPEGAVLADAILPEDGELDFCMCNPPFFAEEAEAHKASHYRACEASKNELVTPGNATETKPASKP
jgi:23S rRNA A1618 N6-methylase RlmF